MGALDACRLWELFLTMAVFGDARRTDAAPTSYHCAWSLPAALRASPSRCFRQVLVLWRF